MDRELFKKFWDVVHERLGSNAVPSIKDYFQTLDTSLRALDITCIYYTRISSRVQLQAQLLLCGTRGFGRIDLELNAAKAQNESGTHKISLSVLPWSEVVAIEQDFIREVYLHFGGGDLLLSKAEMSLRSGKLIDLLLPAVTDREQYRGGVHLLNGTPEPFEYPTVFIGSVIEAKLGKGSVT